MTAVVECLGLTLVKGLTWSSPRAVRVETGGVRGDRHWSPVTPDLRCVRATDFPTMVGLAVSRADLPTSQDALFGGEPRTVTYYGRPLRARVHAGALANRISAAAGQRLYLAESAGPGSFLWSSPVSVLLRSELVGLPESIGRFRANVVLDDREAALTLAPGERLRVGEVVLEVERELERCVIINHDPTTGKRDASLLRRLRPGALLGYGCRVLQPGRIGVGTSAARQPSA